MRATIRIIFGMAAAVLLLAVMVSAPTDASAADGKELFLAAKCNMCHAVPSAAIEAKMKSEKMKGPDMVGKSSRFAAEDLAKFLRKQGELEGKTHKKEFTGSDEDLQAIIAWLATQKAE